MKITRLFIAALVLFLFTRIVLILFAPPELIRDAEFSRGTIAKEIIEGPSWPLYFYQNESFNGGTLFAGILLCPFFIFLGQNFFAIKLAALFFSSLTFTVLYLWLRRSFNERIALLTALSFIFAPAAFTAYSVILMGEHFDSILFTVSALFLFYKVFFEKNGRRNLRDVALLGLVCGLGVWFCYTFLITLATCLLCGFILDKTFFLRKAGLVFLGAGLVGFSPWIWYNAHMGFSGTMIKGKPFFDHFSFSNISGRLWDLATQYFPGAFYFGSEKSTALFPWLPFGYLLIFLTAFVFLLARMLLVKEKKLLPLCVYPVVYLVVFLLSDFKASSLLDTPSYKYLFPLFVFMFVSVAFFVEAGLSHLKGRIKKTVFLFVFLLMPITFLFAQDLRIVSFYGLGRQLRTHKPYSYELLGSSVAINLKGDFANQIKYVQMIRPQYRGYAYRGLGVDLWYDFDALRAMGPTEFKRIEPQYLADFFRGFGMGLFFFDAPPIQIKDMPEEYRKYCFEAAGIIAGTLEMDLRRKIPKEDLELYYVGLGEGSFWRLRDHLGDIEKTIDRVDVKYKKAYLRGLANGVAYCETCNLEKADLEVLNQRFSAEAQGLH